MSLPATGASAVRTDVVPAAVIEPLRRAILRPGQTQPLVFGEDDSPTALHVAAFDRAGTVMGCATFFPEPYGGRPAWRLRGMATDPSVRGRGYGAAVLERGAAEVVARGGDLIWCNARSAAVPFYERHGFSRVGEEFQIDPIGPHFVAVRELPPPVD